MATNVATRKLKITRVAHFVFLLDYVALTLLLARGIHLDSYYLFVENYHDLLLRVQIDQFDPFHDLSFSFVKMSLEQPLVSG